MATRISLNGGDWLALHDHGPHDERNVERYADPDARFEHGFAAVVPGSLYYDLARAGEIPNPYVAVNSRACEWVANRHWTLRKVFVASPAIAGRHVELVLEGIEWEGTIYLNGRRLGTHRGQFAPARYDVSTLLRFDAPNVLVAGLRRAPDEESQIGYTCRVWTHKTRMTYSWDFCARMVGVGIWDDVYLAVSGPARLRDPWVRAHATDDGGGRLEISALIEGATGTLGARVRLRGEVVAQGEARAAGGSICRLTLELDAVELWWPNGWGAQPLYEVELSLVAGGEISDSELITTAFRTVRAVMTEDAPAHARPYALEVNGARMPIRGWNWTPPDVQYGLEQPERYQRLIALAAAANVNLLRVWGGGLIEKEIFYSLCDRAGILVWQEFILSSSGIDNEPSREPAYVALLKHDAPPIIKKRRNHPCLAIWCGGNELQDADNVPLDESHPALAALAACVAEHDPDRHFVPTSALGPYEFLTGDMVRDRPGDLHDVHGPWDYQGPRGQYEIYNGTTALLHSEFGTPGGGHPETVRLFMPLPHCWPPDPAQRDWNNHGEWWTRTTVRDVPPLFGPLGGPDDFERYLLTSQWLQYEGLRYSVEANRRNGRRCAGTMPWQFNVPWPNAVCTNAVDWFTQPKAGYEAVRLAYRNIHASLRYNTLLYKPGETFEAQLWLHCTRAVDDETVVELGAFEVTGLALTWLEAKTFVVKPDDDTDQLLAAVSAVIPDDWDGVFCVQARVRVATEEWRNTYCFSTEEPPFAAMWGAPRTTLEAEAEPCGRGARLVITNRGATPAWWARVWEPRPDTVMPLHPNANLPAALFSDNYEVLLPGETWIVEVSSCGPQLRGRPWRVQAWNSDAVNGTF